MRLFEFPVLAHTVNRNGDTVQVVASVPASILVSIPEDACVTIVTVAQDRTETALRVNGTEARIQAKYSDVRRFLQEQGIEIVSMI